jgi:hypothetical protein
MVLNKRSEKSSPYTVVIYSIFQTFEAMFSRAFPLEIKILA